MGSDFTWQLAVTANYQVSDRVFLSLGWRQLHLDYSDDGTEFDGSMGGPLVGATLTF